MSPTAAHVHIQPSRITSPFCCFLRLINLLFAAGYLLHTLRPSANHILDALRHIYLPIEHEISVEPACLRWMLERQFIATCFDPILRVRGNHVGQLHFTDSTLVASNEKGI